uniref:Glycosyl transferase family 2 n=1 Tax=Pithovirus LCPAC304 TaxID=2506594 RepID=A0A481ZBW8_9VIRU|nr:MAG: glycosyl transferase family 2 [Pithovirus LCPAC304]
MDITLITHILNEEVLLPSWLTHHKKLFTHGIVMDSGSTDRSLDIIREICPTWEIRILTHDEIWKKDIGMVMHLEKDIKGWKCALNVAEYLIIDNLERYLVEFEKNNPEAIGFRTTGVILVDEPDATDISTFTDPEMLLTKSNGYLEAGSAWDGAFHPDGSFTVNDLVYRCRLIHKNESGCYLGGRHTTTLDVNVQPDIYVAWIGRGSPEVYMKKCASWCRPPSGIYLFNGSYYLRMSKREEAYNFWKYELKKAYNIFDKVEGYKKYLDVLYGKTDTADSTPEDKQITISS